MRQQIVEAAKNICIMFINGNMIIASIAATMFIWGFGKN